MINRQRLVDTFLRLAAINSPSKREETIAHVLELDLRELGLHVVRDSAGEKAGSETGNIIATLKGNVRTAIPILLSAHMDTVVPTDGWDYVMEGDTIKSKGETILGADDKAGIAAILEALQVIREEKIAHGDIQVALSMSEESGLWGAKYMDYDLITSKYAFVFDTGRPVGGIVTSAPSHDNIVAKIHGKAAHSGARPEDGISAIVVASKAIAAMKLGRIDEETTANIGTIKGGTARNVVPEFCEVRGEARSRDDEKLDAQVQHMLETFHKAAAEMGAGIDVEVGRSYSTFHHNEDDEVIRLAVAAAKKVGLNPKLHGTGGGSDASVFNAKGLPATVVGVGYEGPHSVNEMLYISEFVKAAEMAVALVEVACGN